MSDLSQEEIVRILELVEKSHFDFFELHTGDLKLTVSKTGTGREAPGTPPSAPSQAVPPAAAQPVAPTSGEARPATPAPAAPAAARASDALPSPRSAAEASRADGLVPVRAPMIGAFYAQPEPGAPPYVQFGANVEEDTTLGLIEVMKVFTAVRAGAKGVIAEILVQNAQFVEFGQTLFLIDPETPSDGERA